MATPIAHSLATAGGELHWLDWGGAGPTLHLAHATGYCAATYVPLAERLSSHLRVVGLDDRGHGRTTLTADPRALHGWETFADDMAIFFRALGGPLIAAGHSRGGTVSLMVAARHPDLVRALILIDPTLLPPAWTPWWRLAQRTGLARYAPIVRRAAQRRYAWPDREAILASYRGKPPFNRWDEESLRAYVEWGTRETSDGQVVWCCHPAWEARCFATYPHDSWRIVKNVRCPTLVLYGLESDVFGAASAAQFARELPSAGMMGFAGTGHFLPMERPSEIANVITSFLEAKALLG